MKLSSALLACALIFAPAAASPAAKVVSAPNDIALIYPAGKTTKDNVVQLGFGNNKGPAPQGLYQYISMTLLSPNGSTHEVVSRRGGAAECKPYTGGERSGGESVELKLVDTGSYTGMWNYTYGTAPNASVLNSTFCGPTHYSYESFYINATFEVVESGGNASAKETHTGTLPSVPTGKVLEGAASTLSGMGMLAVGTATFAMLAVV